MSFMSVHVNIAYDPTMGANAHTLWVPPAPPTPVPVPAFEMFATQMWTAGYFLGQNKFTDTVKHKQFPICQGDHDIGILIPDITFPFVNAYYLIMWPFSSRKMAFSTSAIKFNKQPVGCSQVWPFLPMMTCGDPFTLPSAVPIINLLNPLKVGLSQTDFIMGIAKVVVSIAIDALFHHLGKPGTSDAAKKAAKEAAERMAARHVASQIARTVGKEVAEKFGLTPSTLAKKAVSSLAGFGFSVAEGNPTFKIGILGGPAPEVAYTAGGNGPETELFGVTGLGVSNVLPPFRAEPDDGSTP